MKKSYQKWRECGRQVKHGETSSERSEKGTPLFDISQTKPYQDPIERAYHTSYGSQYDQDFDYDELEWLYDPSFH